MVEIEISEFNINHAVGFRDEEHVERLKKQIEDGGEILVDVYEENGVYKIIDGGHAYYAYQRLGRTPTKLNILRFESNADKIKHSRRKNTIRLQTTPVAYTKSIFMELKLRLGVENDDEVKRILNRSYNVKNKRIINVTEDDRNLLIRINRFFELEPITLDSFCVRNISFLDFPLWLADMVDRGQLTGEQGRTINLAELNDEQKRRVAEASVGASVEHTNRLIDELLPRPIPRAPPSQSISVDREIYHDLTETFESLLAHQPPNFPDEFNNFAEDCLELGLGIWVMRLRDLRERR